MTTQRLALGEMLSILREDDTVVVTRFFRLGRNREHLINLVNEFAKRKVHFKAPDIGIDTTTPAGKFILSIFASLAELGGYLNVRLTSFTTGHTVIFLGQHF